MSNDYRDPRSLRLDLIEPEDRGEGATPSSPPRLPVLTVSDESRRLARVQVSLPASVVIDQDLVIESFTRDISEGGLLLRGYHGPAMLPGTFVNVMLRGIISDDDSADDSADSQGVFNMEVVRSEDDLLALRFRR